MCSKENDILIRVHLFAKWNIVEQSHLLLTTDIHYDCRRNGETKNETAKNVVRITRNAEKG